MVVTCRDVIPLTLGNLNHSSKKSSKPDGSSKFEYVQDKEGQTVYTKVKK